MKWLTSSIINLCTDKFFIPALDWTDEQVFRDIYVHFSLNTVLPSQVEWVKLWWNSSKLCMKLLFLLLKSLSFLCSLTCIFFFSSLQIKNITFKPAFRGISLGLWNSVYDVTKVMLVNVQLAFNCCCLSFIFEELISYIDPLTRLGR